MNGMLSFTIRLLGYIVWISALIFGIYILAFYFVALVAGDALKWNEVLPGLYDRRTPGATVGIGLHFASGGIILILGNIQLIEKWRNAFPAFHRWCGRIYVSAAILTAVGGLLFILLKGTIGGVWMDIAFAGYGVLTFLAAIQTIRFARKGEYDKHRAWAIRLYALAIGSWLYRMDYGFWFLLTDGIGHTDNFTGAFDYFMDFFFYLPNLLVAEFFIRKKQLTSSKMMTWVATIILIAISMYLILATYFFTAKYWGPKILETVLN